MKAEFSTKWQVIIIIHVISNRENHERLQNGSQELQHVLACSYDLYRVHLEPSTGTIVF